MALSILAVIVDCAEPPGAYRVADVAVPEGFRAAVALTGPTRFVVEAAGWPGGEDGRGL